MARQKQLEDELCALRVTLENEIKTKLELCLEPASDVSLDIPIMKKVEEEAGLFLTSDNVSSIDLPEEEKSEISDLSCCTPMEDVLMNSFLLSLHTTVPDKCLPILVASFYSQHIIPAAARLIYRQELIVKKTKWKKIGTFLMEMAEAKMISLFEEKPGVQQIWAVNRLHDDLLNFDPSVFMLPPTEEEDVEDAIVGKKKPKPLFAVPTTGPKKILIEMKVIRGNKNVTTISNLENFGIALDDGLRKDMAKKFRLIP